MNNIEAINILFENGDNVLVSNKDFKDFYISNIDQDGNEIPYDKTIIKNKLYANFLLLKMNKKDLSKINRIKSKYDITEIMVIFKNQKYINFEIASNANPFASNYHNEYEYIYEDDDSLGLLLSQYNIKYKNNLFI
jgi:hypothetical protein